jgi:hypothetical protein
VVAAAALKQYYAAELSAAAAAFVTAEQKLALETLPRLLPVLSRHLLLIHVYERTD